MALLNRDGEVIEATLVTAAAGAITAAAGAITAAAGAISTAAGAISAADASSDAVGGRTISPLAEWQPESGAGLLLEPSDEPDAAFTSAPLIAINFPAFNDGRGLSLAVLLRTRFGYTGELRAVGDVHPDIIHYMKRCGFDTFQMPEGRPLPAAANDNDADGGANTLAPYSDYYQASVLHPQPAFRRVRRGA